MCLNFKHTCLNFKHIAVKLKTWLLTLKHMCLEFKHMILKRLCACFWVLSTIRCVQALNTLLGRSICQLSICSSRMWAAYGWCSECLQSVSMRHFFHFDVSGTPLMRAAHRWMELLRTVAVYFAFPFVSVWCERHTAEDNKHEWNTDDSFSSTGTLKRCRQCPTVCYDLLQGCDRFLYP